MYPRLSRHEMDLGISYPLTDDLSAVIWRSDRDAFGRNKPILLPEGKSPTHCVPPGTVALICVDSPDKELRIAEKLIRLAALDNFPYRVDFRRKDVFPYLFNFFDEDGFVVAFKAAVVIPNDPANDLGGYRVAIAPEAWVHCNSPQRAIASLLDDQVDRFFSFLTPALAA